MTIKEKYNRVRPYINNGDIVLFRGRHLLAKLIQYFDVAYYNHIGIVFEDDGHFFIMDSTSKGVAPDFLSKRINGYQDFCILSPKRNQEEINKALETAFNRGDIGTKYDFLMLPRIAIQKKLGWDIKKLGNQDRDICSEFTRFYTNCLNINCYKAISLITPQDFIRDRNKDEVSILFNDAAGDSFTK